MNIRPFELADKDALISLWQRAGLVRPWNDPEADIERKMTVQSDWFLVGFEQEQLIATVMAGYDGHRGWINYLAVDPDHQRGGFGREIMSYAEQLLFDAGCPKINLMIRKDNLQAISFYENLGFQEDAVACFGKRLIPDR